MANPYNEFNWGDRSATFGIRPDIFESLQRSMPKRSEIDAALERSRSAGEQLDALIDPDNEDSVLWRLQREIDRAQDEVLRQHERWIQAAQAQLAESRREQTANLFLRHDVSLAENEYMSLSRTNNSTKVAWSVKPGWAGHFTVLAGTEGSGLGWANRVFMSRFLAPNPAESELNDSTAVAAVQVTITVTPGSPRKFTGGPTSGTLGRNSWTTLHEFTVPYTTTMTANGALTWSNKTHVATYGLRVTLDGRDITSSSVSPAAPLIHHAARPASATSSVQAVRAGAVVRLESLADHASGLNREYRDATFTVNYIDPTA